MKKALYLVFCLYVFLSVSACSMDNTIKKDVSSSLDAIKSGNSDEGYIYNVDLTGNRIQLIGEDALIRKICSKTTYSISKIEKQGKEKATATIIIISPDIIQMMGSIMEKNKVEDVNQLLSYLESELDSKFLSKEYSVKLSLLLINEHWFIVPNSELVNAFSGGVLKHYSIIERQMVEQLMRGE